MVCNKDDEEEAKMFRFTGDDRRMLWNKGENCLAIVDLETFKVVDMEDFWVNPESRRSIKPVMGIATRDCRKVLGFGWEGSLPTLIYQAWGVRSPQIVPPSCSSYLTSWLCLEVSIDQETCFAGGVFKENPVIASLKFDASVEKIDLFKFTKVKSRSLSRIKRIEGSDIVIAGFTQEVLVLSYTNAQFALLQSYVASGRGEIVSLAFHSKYLFSITNEEHSFQVIEYKNTIRQSDYKGTGKQASPRKQGCSQGPRRRKRAHQADDERFNSATARQQADNRLPQ